MKRKTITIFAGCLFAVFATSCDSNDHNNTTDGSGTETHTEGNKSGTTDGTTSSMGENPTNSTGSTGKAMENHSTSIPDSTKNEHTSGSTTH
jgi:hypothetical protein